MSYSVKWLVRSAVILIGMLSAGLMGFVWFSDAKSDIKLLTIIFTTSLMLVCVVFFLLVSRHVNKVLEALSETIQHMMDESPENTFSDFDDTMLSKLQSQIIRLSDILKSHSLLQKKEKENITALISDISHQLKTPLTNLNMYNSLLLDSCLDDKKRNEFMQNMKNQLEKLNWLMESLIKMSYLETGMVNLNKYSNSIVQTVLKAISMVSLKAEQRNMDITFDGDEAIYICHDTRWTQEAIYNILDNAVKYSLPNTTICVSITKYELFCRVDITDSGMGIRESDINRIFLRFYRGDNAKDNEGVGVGLFLSRKIVTEHGGYIKVKSALDKGSTFSVFLPLN